jgi:hypothetical protein
MTNFLSDLWHDLREKRLWPVALVLLAALVAVPVVLSKSSEDAPAPPPVATEAREVPEPRELKGLAEVKLEEASVGTGSSFDTFDPSNPFRPPRKVIQGPEQADSAGGSDAGPGSATGADTGSKVTVDGGAGTGGGGATPIDSGPVDTGGGDTGGDTGGGDTTTTTQFAYVVDVTFGSDGRTRKIKGMERLDMLPSQASPLLLFLGVTANGGNAVFLVDSTLDTAGEGSCKPSRSECAFLYLGAGSEHEFVNDEGDSYQLKVDEIRKVKVGAKPSARASKKDAKASGAKASAAIGAPDAPRRFVPPILADLVSVSNATAGDSDSNEDRR